MNIINQHIEIMQLIECPKNIIVPPRRQMVLQRGHWRNDMKLQECDGDRVFSVFMRKNADFEENFSIGLIYLPASIRGDIALLRFNGPHGPHISFDHHDRYHIHMADAKNLNNGLKAERNASITEEYASYQEALISFIKRCKVLNATEYFPPYVQLNLVDV